jgi:phospho-N-acetylmuramoyl-pentapeptide-transferase
LVDAGREAARQILVMSVSFVAAAACLGFLVFNHHPAQVFMGNVASMGLGALLAVLAIAGGVWYLLPIIGAVFVVEVLSDIIQIVYFKRTGGKRFFLMAPIHHHFEKLGWPETKIVSVFWSCGLVAALAGIGLAAMLARS